MKTGMNENSGSQPQRILERKKDTLRYKNKPSKNYEKYPNEKNVTPTEIDVSQNKFLWMFKWTDSLIKAKDWENLEATIVQFNDIFARHRLDIGMNMQFKASLTPKDDEKPVYTQSLPVPINLKEDLSVELAQIRDHHDTTLSQVRQPNLCPAETQRQSESSGGSAQNQHTHCG